MNKFEKAAGYWFPEKKITDYYGGLPFSDRTENLYFTPKEKIAIIAVDDFVDHEILRISEWHNVPVTFFVLDTKYEEMVEPKHIGLHFDKERNLEGQIKKYNKFFGQYPVLNRTHRFWWRSDNIDLAYLSLNGLRVDSSKIGITPYRLCVEGRLLPIWEIPFSVYDFSVTNSLHAGYRVANSFEDLIDRSATPIVTCIHPLRFQKKHGIEFDLEAFIEKALKRGYEFLSMFGFYNRYLNGRPCNA